MAIIPTAMAVSQTVSCLQLFVLILISPVRLLMAERYHADLPMSVPAREERELVSMGYSLRARVKLARLLISVTVLTMIATVKPMRMGLRYAATAMTAPVTSVPLPAAAVASWN